MTKEFRVWGLVQDRLSPGVVIQAQSVFRYGDIQLSSSFQKMAASSQAHKVAITDGPGCHLYRKCV